MHLHVNDYGGGYKDWSNMKVLTIGSGKIDFETFFRKTFEIGYKGDFTVESTALDRDGTVDFDMLTQCFDKIRDYVKKYNDVLK